MNGKDFLDQFLQYLQSYYGGRGGSPKGMSPVANLLKMPIFQAASTDTEPQMPEMDEMGMANQLNDLFPGPYDPMRLN